MSEMPTLGRSRKRPVAPRVIAIVVVLALAIIAWLYLRGRHGSSPSSTTMAPTVTTIPGVAPPTVPPASGAAPASGVATTAKPTAKDEDAGAGSEAPPPPPTKSAGELELE